MKHIIKVKVLENLPEIRPLIAMDVNGKFFQQGRGGGSPEPVGPPNNEIWYWGEYYDLATIISILNDPENGGGVQYVGPAILSNEQVGDKYVITFKEPITELGANIETETYYPLFVNIPEIGVLCNITRLEIPNSVTNIEYGAFWGCTGLTSVTIGNSVTSISEWTFGDCYDLAAVTIGNSVKRIETAAFSECRNLASITCMATTPPNIPGSTFFYASNQLKIYVPTDSVEVYKSAENWSEYASRIYAIPE